MCEWTNWKMTKEQSISFVHRKYYFIITRWIRDEYFYLSYGYDQDE